MTDDKELIARLRGYGHVGTVLTAADRIEELVKEVDRRIEPEQVEKLVMLADPIMSELYAVECSCRQEAEAKLEKAVEALEALTEQRNAARQDAVEAEAYVGELEAKLATCEKYRDAYAECDRIGTQAVRDLEDKLEKARNAALREAAKIASRYNVNRGKGSETARAIISSILAEIKGESHE